MYQDIKPPYVCQRPDAARRADGARPLGGDQLPGPGRLRLRPARPARRRLGARRPDHPRGRRPRQPGADARPRQPRRRPRRERRRRCTCASGGRRSPATCPPRSRSTPTSSAARTCPDEELEPVQALALQDIQSLEDEPRQKVMVELRRRHYPAPLSQDHRGTRRGHREPDRRRRPRPLPPPVPAERARSCPSPATSTGSRCATQVEPAVRRLAAGRRPDRDARPAARPSRDHLDEGHARRRRSPSPTRACRSATPTTTPPTARSACSPAA